MPKTNMAVYLRHFLGVDKAKVLTEPPMPQPLISFPSDVALATNLHQLEQRVHPGMIIMAPSPEQIRRERMMSNVSEGIHPISATPYIRKVNVGSDVAPELLEAISKIEMSKEFALQFKPRPYQEHAIATLTDGMVPARALGDPHGMSYCGIQPRRHRLDKIYGNSTRAMIVDEVHQPLIVIPKIKKEQP